MRWKVLSLPYRVFDRDQQRVSPGAITENKHLSAALAYAQEFQKSDPPKVERVGKQRTRYQPTGKCRPGRPSCVDRRIAKRAAEAAHAAE